MTALSEIDIEKIALDWLRSLGWSIAHGSDISPDEENAEREDYGEVVLKRRLLDALGLLNPELPEEAIEDAFRKLTHPRGSTLEARNRNFHGMITVGVTVE